ncbi:hypothetical protein OEW28_15885 [Defluviimonas sp. WL0002]|uniref:Alpha/beta hydrolase n=1 Tax=Albidovulum marisflavi TaxID=2984159 RepID=A0ABT2ZG58_9RHOB|nr:hypothetical protein [Defluviimonas sp. WL0002]MCV2870110.1 hypothetical protein [Defluviimonas sp. WL0002]
MHQTNADMFLRFDDIRREVLEAGGQYIVLPSHVIVHVPGKERLVVAFDNRASINGSNPRRPWGDALIRSQGWGLLGVMSTKQNWYRCPALFAALEDLCSGPLLDQYDHFSLYGNSMGGYGALTFASLFPDPIVVTFNPQTSLSPDVVPFERRFEPGRSLGDWSGPYIDGKQGAANAQKVYVFYDPMVLQDKLHALRMEGENAVLLGCPWLTHPFMSMFASMQLLRPTAVSALKGELNRSDFYRSFRRRRSSDRYMYELLSAAVARNHLRLAQKGLQKRLLEWPAADQAMLEAIVNQERSQ